MFDQLPEYKIDLNWKDFNIDLVSVDTWFKTKIGDNYLGNSAYYDFTLYFKTTPDDSIIQMVKDYWDAIDEHSPEVANYSSIADKIAADQAAKAEKLASATSKLTALGLTADEISALMGK